MNRRALFGLLLALPFVGRLARRSEVICGQVQQQTRRPTWVAGAFVLTGEGKTPDETWADCHLRRKRPVRCSS